jgi:hypothetical protein
LELLSSISWKLLRIKVDTPAVEVDEGVCVWCCICLLGHGDLWYGCGGFVWCVKILFLSVSVSAISDVTSQLFRHSMFSIFFFGTTILMVWAVGRESRAGQRVINAHLVLIEAKLDVYYQTGMERCPPGPHSIGTSSSGAANTGTGGATPVAAARVEGALEMA